MLHCKEHGCRSFLPQQLEVQSWIEWWCLHHFQSDRCHTSARHSQPNGGSARKVDDPRFHEWPAIVDPNHDAPISIEAAHPHSGAKGKGPVRRCQLLLIVNLSAR